MSSVHTITINNEQYNIALINPQTNEKIEAPETVKKNSDWVQGYIQLTAEQYGEFTSMTINSEGYEYILSNGEIKEEKDVFIPAFMKQAKENMQQELDIDIFADKKDGKDIFRATTKLLTPTHTPPINHFEVKSASEVIANYDLNKASKTEKKKWQSSGHKLVSKEVFDIQSEVIFNQTLANKHGLNQSQFQTTAKYLYNSPVNGSLDENGQMIEHAITPSSAVGIIDDHLANVRIIGYEDAEQIEQTDLYASARPQNAKQIEELVGFMFQDQFEKKAYKGIYKVKDDPDGAAYLFHFADFSLMQAQKETKNFKQEVTAIQQISDKVIEIQLANGRKVKVRCKPIILSRSPNIWESITLNSSKHRKHDKQAIESLEQLALMRKEHPRCLVP